MNTFSSLRKLAPTVGLNQTFRVYNFWLLTVETQTHKLKKKDLEEW